MNLEELTHDLQEASLTACATLHNACVFIMKACSWAYFRQLFGACTMLYLILSLTLEA